MIYDEKRQSLVATAFLVFTRCKYFKLSFLILSHDSFDGSVVVFSF